MRVDYTLPALQPGTLTDQPAASEVGPSFRQHLRVSALPVPADWQHQLGLDARPFTATYIGPPPRPQSLQLYDAETERLRWRNMLWKHSNDFRFGDGPGTAAAKQAVQELLAMLVDMQQGEDSIISQSVAVTRG